VRMGARHLDAMASALFRVAETRGRTAAVSADLRGLSAMIGGSPLLREFAASPVLGRRQRDEALRAMFAGRVDALALTFALRLDAYGMLGRAAEAAEAFDRRRRRASGERRVEVRSARALDERARDAVRARLRHSDPRIEAVFVEDPSLLAGLAFREDDRVIDFSAAARLRKLRAAWTIA